MPALSPPTHTSPSPTEVCPRTLKRGRELSTATGLFLQKKIAEENAHIKELKKYHEHVSLCVCTVYMSA